MLTLKRCSWRRSASTSRPRSELGIASVIDDVGEPLINVAGPSKLTQRLFSVRPASWRASLFAWRSTSTRCTLPTMRRLIARACSLSCACSRSSRACFSACVTSSGNAAAGVPGRWL